MTEWAIPLAALIISLITFVVSQWSITRTTSREDVRDLLDRVQRLEMEVRECHQQRDALQLENIAILRQLFDRREAEEKG